MLPTDHLIRTVTSLSDPAVPLILDLFQISFPLVEQMPVSFWWTYLSEKQQGGRENATLVVYQTPDYPVAGFAFWEMGEPVTEAGGKAVSLWYIATNPAIRGGGFGRTLYEYITDSVFADDSCRAMTLEVEIPEEARTRDGEEAARFAERRLNWYAKLGAKRLGGVGYHQSTGWQPAIEMAILVHPSPHYADLTPEEAVVLGNSVLDDGIKVSGKPFWQ